MSDEPSLIGALDREKADDIARKYDRRSLAKDFMCAVLSNADPESRNTGSYENLVRDVFELADEFLLQWESDK